MNRRVVVTGLGLVTPLGIGAPVNWIKLTQGVTSTQKIVDPAFDKIPCQVAAFVPQGDSKEELNVSDYFNKSERRTVSLSTIFAIVAAQEALEDAQWMPSNEEDSDRTGVAIGVGMADIQGIVDGQKKLEERYRSLSPYFVPLILNNMAAAHVSMRFKLRGPNHSVSTACATGCHSIGDAFRFIKCNDADVMICGGTEASITPLSLAGFCRLRALSTSYNDEPEKSSRPFDSGRDGFVMGEGSGILVLEELQHALKRNARIYAEVLGYGFTGDAYHITAPREDGNGVVKSMEKAITNSGIDKENIGYINAHATSTPVGDALELQAIESVFGSSVHSLKVSSTKGATGHLLGGAGAVESIYTLLACHAGYIPPTANLVQSNANTKIDLVPHVAKPWLQTSTRRVALCNSLGFGGTNATICFSSYE